MATLQQRKKQPPSSASSSYPSSRTSTSPRRRSAVSVLSTLFTSLALLLFTAAATSYIVTETFTFGYPVPNWRKYLPVKERIFTDAELAQYDGSDPNKPVYLAINGKVYDVTAGRKHYGKGGSYSTFSGRDAARAYITGCFQTHLTHDLRGITEEQMKSLNHWTDFYEKNNQYFYVGRVIHDPIDPASPIPEDCGLD
ncbi:hypothetical protein HK104_006037 [Borealophlyctis nickersoniae]|nr:hypothetical protein HK104_006037 [Borealophlyctis nickersoniae]